MSHLSIPSPSATSDPEYRKINSGDLWHFRSHGWRGRYNPPVHDRIIVAAWLMAALWATGVMSLSLLWLMGVGDDPLLLLASAPF